MVEANDPPPKERVVTGGATAFPRLPDPRPIPNDTLDLVKTAIIKSIRGPLLAVLATRASYPLYAAAVTRLKALGLSEASTFATLTTGVHVGVYAVFNGTFGIWDYFGLMQEYKLIRNPRFPPSRELVIATLKDFGINAVLGWVGLRFVVWRLMAKCRGKDPELLASLPSNIRMFASFCGSMWFNSIAFTLAHRALHSKALYKTFHKQHHQWIGTQGISAEYSGPVENLLANMVPTLAVPVLSKAHPWVLMSWLAWRLEETYEAHSGYCFVGTRLHSLGLTHGSAAAYHDLHHQYNKGNFGGDPILDRLMRTDDFWISIGGEKGYIALKQKANESA